MYSFEVHLHTSACSKCGSSTAEEMIDAAKAGGYSGLVLTNHFYRGNTCIDRELPWKEFVGAYAEEYYRAKEYGKQQGIVVLFGLEEVYAPGKEALIYGITPECVAAEPEFKKMSLAQLSAFVHKNGGVIVCAHPFRDRAYIPDPDTVPDVELFDGIECFNLGNKPEENVKAFALACNYGARMISGSDVHSAGRFGLAGIAFEEPVETDEDFLRQFKAGAYQLICDGTRFEK